MTAPLGDAASRAQASTAEAERVILGAVLVEPACAEALEALQPHDFQDTRNRAVFEALRALVAAHTRPDVVTLKAQLQRDRVLERIGGAAYIAALADGLPRVTHLAEWTRALKRASALRQLRAIGQRLAGAAAVGEDEPEELLARCDRALLRVGAGVAASTAPQPIAAGAKAAFEAIERRANGAGLLGYSTGLWELDQLLGGIRLGCMGVIGARLGSGKSILGLQVAAAIAEQDRGGVLVLSLEMDVAELAERRLAALAHVDPTWLHMATPQEREARMARLAAAWGKLPQNLLVLEDAYTVPELRIHARQVQAERGLSAVIVDYVGLMDATDAARGAREWEKVASISKALRRLAAELRVPVIVIAQLNREPEGGGKRRPPTMADLAGSDVLGRDCHWCVLIDMEPPAEKGHDPQSTRGVADLYLRKNRGGRKGVVRVCADLGLAAFRTLEPA